MFSSLKKISSDTLIYGIGRISIKLIGFVLLPLYTSYLSTADYGIFNLLEISKQVLIMVFSLNFDVAMIRLCSQEKELDSQKTIIFNAYFFITIFSIITMWMFSLKSGAFSKLIFGTDLYAAYIRLTFIVVIFSIINKLTQYLIRLREKPILYTVLTIIRVVVIIILNINFIAIKKIGIIGLVYSLLIGEILFLGLSSGLIIKNIKIKFNLKAVNEMIVFGFPLILSAISSMILGMSDKYMVRFFLSANFVGIFALAYKIANVSKMLVINSFQMGFFPIALKTYDSGEYKFFFKEVATIFTFVLAFFSLGISLLGRELIEVLARKTEFWAASYLLPMISFTIILSGIQYFFSLSTYLSKKTFYNSYLVTISAVINIGLNIWLIPTYYIFGAIISSIVSLLFLIIVYYKLTINLIEVKYDMTRIIKIIFVYLIIIVFSFLFSNFGFISRLFIKIALILLFPLILFLMKFFKKNEVVRIKKFFSKN